MDDRPRVGPDVVVAGAARSGTSFLAAVLGSHARVDPGAVKEPNFFSREYSRGAAWYDGMYEPRTDGMLRLDASMSYTFPHFPDALSRLAETSPDALVVYAVREPVARALSHYRLHRDYFQNEPSADFATALRTNPLYLGAGDYQHWLARLQEHFPRDKVIVVPFSRTVAGGREVADVIFGALGLDAPPATDEQAEAHRNDVVVFRNKAFLHARRWIRHRGAYPWLRRTIGNQRMRSLRERLTQPVSRESDAQALSTCTPEQHDMLTDLYARSRTAVSTWLHEQDGRLGVEWRHAWEESVPAGTPTLVAQAQAGRDD